MTYTITVTQRGNYHSEHLVTAPSAIRALDLVAESLNQTTSNTLKPNKDGSLPSKTGYIGYNLVAREI